MIKPIKKNIRNQIKFSYLYVKQYKKFQKFIYYNHSKKHIFVKSKKVFDWFYKKNKIYNLVVAYKNKSIIGVQGFIPFSKFDNILKNYAFLAYWRVKKTKELGVGLRLFKIIKNNNFKFTGVVGINNELINYHKWQGFNTGKLDHHFFINNNLRAKKIIKFSKTKEFIKENINLIKLNKNNIYNINNKIFDYQYPKKTKKYLSFRYLNNKFYNYNLFYLKSKKVNLILVFRIVEIKNLKIMKIIDLIGNQLNVKFIGSAMNFLLKKFNCEYSDFYSFGISKKCLSQAGFYDRYQTKEVIPDLFEPFINKNRDINYAYMSKIKKNLRMVKGDGDMDRPSRLF